MTSAVGATLVVARLVVLGLGLSLTLLAGRAYRRERSRYLRTAVVGFGVITLGVLVEGLLFQFTTAELATVHLVESAAIALGFAILLSSFVR